MANLTLPEWKIFLLEARTDTGGDLFMLPEMRLNELAGALARNFPERLYRAFKADLESGGAAFGGMVLRLLCRVTNRVETFSGQPGTGHDFTPLLRRFDEIAAGIQNLTQPILDRLDESTCEILSQLDGFRTEVRLQLDILQTTAIRHLPPW